MAWEEMHVDTWTQIIQLFGHMDYGRPSEASYLYRGHSDADWQLVDSLSRLLTLKAFTGVATHVEQVAFRTFLAQAHLFLDPSTLPSEKSLLAWWSLMQHYGAPTRLLDWTASPYIALYFAVVNNWSKAGAVWAFNPIVMIDENRDKEVEAAYNVFRWSTDESNQFWRDAPLRMVYPFYPKRHHARISTQQGWFSVCGTLPSNHGEIIDTSYVDSKHKYCKKIIIDPTLKPLFLRNLTRMNITANSLFPGLDGLGKSIHELVRLEASHELSGLL